MTSYIALLITFITGFIAIVRDIVKNFTERKNAKRLDKKKRISRSIILNFIFLFMLLCASGVSFKKQIDDDNEKVSNASQHRKELENTMSKLTAILNRSETVLLRQEDARQKLAAQLDSTSLLLNTTHQNLNNTNKALTEFARQNTDLKNIKISFTITYNYSDKSYNKWFTSSYPDNALLTIKKYLSSYAGRPISFKGPFVGGHMLTGSELVFMGKNTCIVTNIKDRDTTVLWLGVFGITYPGLEKVETSAYDSFFPFGESLSVSFQKKFTKTDGSEKFWDIQKYSDLLLVPQVKDGKEINDIYYREIDFVSKTVRQDIINVMVKNVTNNSIKSLLDLNNVYINVYPSSLTKSKISNLFMYCGDDYANQIFLDPYQINRISTSKGIKILYHLTF